MASSTPMEAALRGVDRLFREGTDAGLPDDRLLDRFLSRSDDEAFATLVARHGPMVLRTARDVLRDPGIAEDAFQATFLTLASRAGSIRGESVGAWLHRVAHRAALRLNAREARRRREERGAAEAARSAVGPDSRGGPEWDDLRAAIHAEVERLPDRYRRPVVLCLMGGMSQPEAAAQLGVSCGCSPRPARAGPGAAPRPAGSPRSGPGGPPGAGRHGGPAGLGRGGRRRRPVVRGGSMVRRSAGWRRRPHPGHAVAVMVAGGYPGRGGRRRGPGGPLRTPGPGPAETPIAGQGARRARSVAAGRCPGKKVAVRGRVLGPGGKPVAKARIFLIPDYRFDATLVAASEPDGSFRFERPEEAFRPDPHAGIPPSWPAVLVAMAEGFGTDWCAVGESVAGGRTSSLRPEYDRDFHLPDDRPIKGRVVDITGRPVAGAQVEVREIGVPPDLDWGPILDDLRALKNVLPPRRTWSTVINPWSAPFVPPTETDAEGRFRIAGLGRDRLVGLRVRGPGSVPTGFSVMNRDDVDDLTRDVRAKYPPAPRLEGADPRAKADPGVLLFGPGPAVEVEPARTYGGTVFAADSGEPLRDVGLSITSLNSVGGRNYGGGQATSGPDGRFRGLRGDGSPTIWVYAIPDRRGDYLPATRRFDGVEAPGEVKADFRLARGVVVKGRAIEAGTGRPIVASPNDDCHNQGVPRAGFVTYYPLASNAALRDSPTGLYLGDPEGPRVETSATIDGEGAFRILVPPGPGVLLVMAAPGMSMGVNLMPTPTWPEVDTGRPILRLFPYAKLRARIPGDGAPPTADPSVLPGLAGPIPLASYHAYRVIDPPADAREMAVEIALDRGRSRPVKFVDPRGDPVRGPTVFGLVSLPRPINLAGSEGEATALEPDRDRPLLAVSSDGRYFAKSSLRGDATTPVTIAMEPTGVVTGRLVDAVGRPVAHHAIALEYDDAAESRPPGFADVSLPHPSTPPADTDADGRFRVVGLIPGFRASVWFSQKPPPGTVPTVPLANYRPGPLRKVAVRSGETLDVGDVRATADR